jgi:acetylornithine deacetylase/succinyl-diaminopimelate desuccinylase-like protein
MRLLRLVAVVLAVIACSAGGPAAQTAARQHLDESRQLLADLIAIDTSQPHGSTTPAAQRVARFLEGAGFAPDDVRVIGASDRLGNVVARLPGRGGSTRR